MNPLCDQFFNPKYANQAYLQRLHWQQHDAEQCQEIMNAVNAIAHHPMKYQWAPLVSVLLRSETAMNLPL